MRVARAMRQFPALDAAMASGDVSYAKARVLAMMRSLAVEWGPKGVRTLAVTPGMFPTEATDANLRPYQSQPVDREREVPLRRLGDHLELATCSHT